MIMPKDVHDHAQSCTCTCPKLYMFPNKEIALKFLFRIWHLPIFWNFLLLNLYLPIFRGFSISEFGIYPFVWLEICISHIMHMNFKFYKKIFLTSPKNFPSKDYFFINYFFLLEKKAFMIIHK